MEGAPWESGRVQRGSFLSGSETFLMVFQGAAIVLGWKSRVRRRVRERTYAPSQFPHLPREKWQKGPWGPTSKVCFKDGFPGPGRPFEWRLDFNGGAA